MLEFPIHHKFPMIAPTPPALPLNVTLQRAVAHHKAGRLQEAERLYRAILQVQPSHPDANHNLGVLAGQAGNLVAGLPFLKIALAINPSQGQYALSYADALLATGQPKEALSILQRAMQRGLNTAGARSLRKKIEGAIRNSPAQGKMPTQAEMNQLVALFHAGRFAELENQVRVLVEQYPNSGPSWNLLGISLQAQGKEALSAIQKAVELLPDDAVVHGNLGNVLRDLGKLDDAMTSYRRALEINPNLAGVHSNLGNVLRDLGQTDDAVAYYRRALEISPDFAEAYNNLGAALQAQGKPDEAVESLRQALKINPDYAEAHSNLSVSLKALNLLGDSARSARRALEIKPDFMEAHSHLGNTLQALMQLDEAIAHYQQALKIDPHYTKTYLNLGITFTIKGDLHTAKTYYRKAQELGLNDAQIYEALILPFIMGTRQKVMESRADFEHNLDQLIVKAIHLDDPLTKEASSQFFLAYHGLNDRHLQIKIAKFYENACPSLLYTAPHCIDPIPDNNTKTRIGFLSKFIYSHSVSRSFSRIVEALSKKDSFEVALISSHDIDDEAARKTYSDFVGKHVHLPYHLKSAREKIADLKLDILVYLDIGMEPLSYFLAFSRLARVQCVLAGHPVTTGIGNMDYFLSSTLMEPTDADKHYSEKLVCFPKGVFYLEKPTLPPTFKTRGELGLPEKRHIYMCPMMLQKMHPDFDEAISRILQIDSNGLVVLFEDNKNPYMKTMLAKRFEETIPESVRDRVVFLPWIKNYSDFISANAAADVILDPFHFGIGSTIIATFSVGTPIVTKPGEFMRGRVGMALCKMMDIPECIAEDIESYVQKAVQIASNQSLRDSIKAKILKNAPTLYDNLQPVDDLVDFFNSLAGGSA